jgi:hypothetical protein
LIVIFTGGRSEGDDFCHHCHRWLTHAPIIMHFAVFSQTATKKTANGDRHAMLKMIQHGVTIAKY